MSRRVIVVGSGLGGLSAAIHARLNGWDVTVLEQHDGPGGKARPFEQEGYRFDPGPSIVILKEIYEAVFERAGVPCDLSFRRLDPFTRVFFEGGEPVDLPADPEGCMEVLSDQAREDLPAMRKLLDDLDQVYPAVERAIFGKPIEAPWQFLNRDLAGFAKKMPVAQPYRIAVDQRFRSPLLRAFFYGFPSYSGQSYRSPSPGSFVIPWAMIRRGVWWPEGGIGAIPAALYRLAVHLGVEFQFQSPVIGLRVEGGRVRAVEVPGALLKCHAVISNLDRLTARKWLSRPTQERPSYSYFTIHWGLKTRPTQASHHTLVIPKSYAEGFEELYTRRDFPSEPIVYLNETAGTDPATAPPGGGNLFAVVTCPALEDHLDWRTLRDEAIERTRRIIAKVGLDPREEEIVVRHVQTPITFQQRDGSYRGSLYGADEKTRRFGFLLPSNRDEYIPNLLYANGTVQPGAGMPMVVLSGKFAADLLGRA